MVVVLGYESSRARAEIADLGIDIATNPDCTGPPSASLLVGLECVDPAIPSTVVMLADMVHVTDAMVKALVAATRRRVRPMRG